MFNLLQKNVYIKFLISCFRWDSKVSILSISYDKSLKIRSILLPASNYQSTKVIKKKTSQEAYPLVNKDDNSLSPYITTITCFFNNFYFSISWHILLVSHVQVISYITYDVTTPTPYTVITILTTFLMLYFTSHNYFVITNLYFWIPSPFHPPPQNLLSSGSHQSVLCICEFVAVFFILFLRFHV